MDIIKRINQSFIMIGVAAFLGNIGTKYIFNDFPPEMHKALNHRWMRKVYVFSIVFIATRDAKVSFLITVLYAILIKCFQN